MVRQTKRPHAHNGGGKIYVYNGTFGTISTHISALHTGGKEEQQNNIHSISFLVE